MSPTSQPIAPARGKWLKGVWARIPDRPFAERELDERILELTGAYAGDYAYAAAVRGSLVAAQAVSVRQGDGGKLEYRRAVKWIEWPDNGPGSEGWNAEMRRRHEADMRMLERERELAWETSDAKREQDRLIALIDERIDTRLGELRSLAERDER